jgi:Protein of unknown function (DUF1579)
VTSTTWFHEIGHLADVPIGARANAEVVHERTVTKERTMNDTDAQATEAYSMPTPDPALRQFDRFIGTWEMKGRTVGSDVDDVVGIVSYSWLPGGFFLEQKVKITFTNIEVEGVEIIGYDPETGTFPSTVYSSLFGSPLPYRWILDGDELTIKAETLHATYHGRWSDEGRTFSGGWRGDPGHENDPGNVAYDVSGTRIKAD